MARQSLTFSCFVVLAALVVLVQRNTFVRRWLLPPPAGEAKLREVLPRVQFVDLTLPQAVGELARLAGVPIELDPKLVELDSDVVNKWVSKPRIHRLDLKDVTLQQTLELLCEVPLYSEKSLAIVPQGDGIKVGLSPDESKEPGVLRVYDVSDFLPPQGPTPPQPPSGPFHSAPRARSKRDARVERVIEFVKMRLPTPQAASFSFQEQPVDRLDGRIFVIAPRATQAEIGLILRSLNRTPASH